MKKGIHPNYVSCTISCASCGRKWETRSTRPELKIELCSQCHPLFTGEEVLVDTAGQIDKFNRRVAMAQKHQSQKQAKNVPTMM